jgi:hypothetical protein
MSYRHALDRRSLILALVLGLFGGGALASTGACGASATSAEAPDEQRDAPVPERGKQWSNWRWKGKRDDCFFRHKNRCFSRLTDACRAAACRGKSACVHDESAPAVVSCQK